MSTEQEHEIVPAIRDWLFATSDVESPTGLSRDEARQRARDLLARLAAGSVTPDSFEVDDETKDILCALVEELDRRPLGSSTFDDCDSAYRFVLAIRWPSDHFGEQDDVLHRIACIGWRSAPGGLEAVLKARAAIWEHGDEQRHREVCETAEELPERIRALRRQETPQVAEIREICVRLIKLAPIRPGLVAPSAAAAEALLVDQDRRIGSLDDREHLKSTAALAAGMGGRQLGKWNAAKSGYARAACAFRRTADRADLDRVEVERLALEYSREDYRAVVESAPALIESLLIPRERLKAQLMLGWALLSLDRPREAKSVLESAQLAPVIEREPALRVCLLTILGNALSYLACDAEAMSSFRAAAAILEHFHHPLQLAYLAAAMGEHFGKLGELAEALVLYRTARNEYGKIGQPQFVAYMSVLVAELLMLLGKAKEAEAELLATLPLIEKYDLRREAVAAVALLREALAKRRTDVKTIQALRDQLRKGLH